MHRLYATQVALVVTVNLYLPSPKSCTVCPRGLSSGLNVALLTCWLLLHVSNFPARSFSPCSGATAAVKEEQENRSWNVFDLQCHWGGFAKQVHASSAVTKICLFQAGSAWGFCLGGSFGAFEMFRHCPSPSRSFTSKHLWLAEPPSSILLSGSSHLDVCNLNFLHHFSSSVMEWVEPGWHSGCCGCWCLPVTRVRVAPRRLCQGEMWSRCCSQTIAWVLQ